MVIQLDSNQLQKIINTIEKIKPAGYSEWTGYVMSMIVGILSGLFIQMIIDYKKKRERKVKKSYLDILVSRVTNFSDNSGEKHKNLNDRLLKIKSELEQLCGYYYIQNINADSLLDIIMKLERLTNRMAENHNGCLTDEESDRIYKISMEQTESND